MFLKIYIKAFQLATDLDDTVEDKLLIGDRPKPSLDPEVRLPLKERLAKRTEEELQEVWVSQSHCLVTCLSMACSFEKLTPDELVFLKFATALTEWLAPYHDFTRPPPSTVLAKTAEQTGLRTGHTLKGVELPSHGLGANGNGKKEEDIPPIRDAPEAVTKYFDGEYSLNDPMAS